MTEPLVTAAEIARTAGLADWRVLLRTVQAAFRLPSQAAAVALVGAVAEAGERHGRHPDVVLRHPGRVRVVFAAADNGGLDGVDVELAAEISRSAAALGAVADPTGVAELEVGIDTMDAERIRPFWAAVLGYRDGGDTLADPLGIGPVVWFQQMDEPRTDRNRIHLDVTVAHDVAEARVAAALAAGGRLMSDAHARSWWVLADADGNEACICTWQDRT